MSSRRVDLLFSDHRRNCIPVGRQLPRTPPSQPNCVKLLDFPSEQRAYSPAQQVPDQENPSPNTTFDFRTPPDKQDLSDDPESMVKGMKGYQLTPADLDFMQKLKEEKELKKVQEDLKTAQKALKSEMTALDVVLSFRENAQAELNLLPSCEDIRQWSVLVLEMSAPSVDLSELDTKALLALVTPNDAKKSVQAKKAELKQLEKMVEKKKKNDAKERALQERQIAIEQSKLLSLMSRLAELKSALAQQEEINKSLKTPQEKVAPRRVKAKQTSDKSDPTSKPPRRPNQQQKTEPAVSAQKIQPDAPPRAESSPAPADQASAPSESRSKGRKGKVAAVPGEKGQRRGTRPGAPSDMATPAAPTRSRRKSPAPAPAEEPNLGVRRSKRIACRK